MQVMLRPLKNMGHQRQERGHIAGAWLTAPATPGVKLVFIKLLMAGGVGKPEGLGPEGPLQPRGAGRPLMQVGAAVGL